MKKRVSLSLTDAELSFIFAAMSSFAPDIDDEDDDAFEKLMQRILKTRDKVRGKS